MTRSRPRKKTPTHLTPTVSPHLLINPVNNQRKPSKTTSQPYQKDARLEYSRKSMDKNCHGTRLALISQK